MPNRIIKEMICTSDQIDRLDWFSEVLWYRLIVNCDDYGRFDGRVSVIKNRLFPLKTKLTLQRVKLAIDRLAKVGLIKIYYHNNLPFIYLPSWQKHQNIRAKRSKYPAPSERLDCDESICNQVQANVPVIQSNTIQSNSNTIQSESNINTADAFCIFADGDEEMLGLLAEFQDMRVKKGRPLSAKSKERFIERLVGLSGERTVQIEMLQSAIDHCWLTVYPPRVVEKPNTKSSNIDDYVHYVNQLIKANEEA